MCFIARHFIFSNRNSLYFAIPNKELYCSSKSVLITYKSFKDKLRISDIY